MQLRAIKTLEDSSKMMEKDYDKLIELKTRCELQGFKGSLGLMK